MYRISNVNIPLFSDRSYEYYIAKKLSVPACKISDVRLLRKSLDARKKGQVHYVCTFVANISEVAKLSDKDVAKYEEKKYRFPYKNITSDKKPIIIGTGPAGLFCALMLARAGLRPVVFERGSNVEKRVKKINDLRSFGLLDANTNVQFGEGGAGTFSDGKLTCGLNDIRTEFVLSEFVKSGAPEEIMYLAKPHIGTDYLRHVVVNMRNEIISLGGEVYFDSLFTDFLCNTDGKVKSVEITDIATGDKRNYDCSCLVLALGHSSRDTYRMLCDKGMQMTKKPFSVGVRIEHKREYINLLRYKDEVLAESLPAADYKLSCHPDSRGVYTFCMCPGGEVVCASSEEGGVVTNGMSYFSRDMDNSNSALLVSVYPEDTEDNVLSGMELQSELERQAYKLGGGGYFAPCQKVGDFLNDVATQSFGDVKPSYLPGVRGANLRDILPDFVAKGLKAALIELDGKMRGFLKEDAVLTGVETRSSAPLRIVRDDNMQSSDSMIYPIGEGAGYAGGIMSAAMDGIRCAEEICRLHMPEGQKL